MPDQKPVKQFESSASRGLEVSSVLDRGMDSLAGKVNNFIIDSQVTTDHELDSVLSKLLIGSASLSEESASVVSEIVSFLVNIDKQL
jgi:hypothetical protein